MDEPSEQRLRFNEKVVFVVGLLAVLFAAYPLKPLLDGTRLGIVGVHVSLTQLTFPFMILLGICLYFYALNHTRFDNPRILEQRWTRHFESAGDLCYFVAIALYPPLVCGLWLLTSLFTNIALAWSGASSLSYATNSALISAGAIAAVLAIAFSFSQAKAERTLISERLENETIPLSSVDDAYRGKLYDMMVIRLQAVAESRLRQRLLGEYGPIVQQLMASQLFSLARKARIISQEEHRVLTSMRVLRNQAAHGIVSIDEKTAARMKKGVEDILSSL